MSITITLSEIRQPDLRTYSPPKIKRIRIIENPFEDIVPRITAEEKRAQQRAREQAQRERENEQRLRGAKKYAPLQVVGTRTLTAHFVGT